VGADADEDQPDDHRQVQAEHDRQPSALGHARTLVGHSGVLFAVGAGDEPAGRGPGNHPVRSCCAATCAATAHGTPVGSGSNGPEEAGGAELHGEAEAGVLAGPHVDQVAVGRVEVEIAVGGAAKFWWISAVIQ